ncbi:MAG TPA: DoxX family membrane protein [Candidatus Acidoferrales bacterium]|jgi:putative oxidoreductase|nr:DoxX family membrane protein [Candidatus Acidoferrales bacterium]
MVFPQLARFTDVALLFLRLMVGVVFLGSGYSALKNPEARSKDIETSKAFAIFLGAAEVVGALVVSKGKPYILGLNAEALRPSTVRF